MRGHTHLYWYLTFRKMLLNYWQMYVKLKCSCKTINYLWFDWIPSRDTACSRYSTPEPAYKLVLGLLKCTLMECAFDLFLDVDECATSIHNCHFNSTCTNINGTFLCICNRGFTGNGTFCEGKFFKIIVLITEIHDCNICNLAPKLLPSLPPSLLPKDPGVRWSLEISWGGGAKRCQITIFKVVV